MHKQIPITIEKLTEESFHPYGEIITPGEKNLFIEYPDGSAFHVLAQAKSQGWRFAALKLRTRSIEEMQVHRTTTETLDPVKGVALLCVNVNPSLEGLKAFILDRPVLIYIDIWHNILTLTEESIIEITENNEVDSEEVGLGVALTPQLFSQ
jgi:ureidoglycolate hydrolase